MDNELFNKLVIFLLGAACTIIIYFIKRFIEGKKPYEKLVLNEKVLDVNEKMEKQNLSPEQVEALKSRLLSLPELGSLQKGGSENSVIEMLWEMLAIHAGNEAKDASSLKLLFPELITDERINLARATFHAAFRICLRLNPDSLNIESLKEYESEIPVPEDYKIALEKHR